jgi:chromate reductase, NAD(P)H dehydrogenase (quinone)
MRLLGIAGSLRSGSHNRALLRAAAALLPPGAELQEWRGLADLPAYDEDLDGACTPGRSPPPTG